MLGPRGRSVSRATLLHPTGSVSDGAGLRATNPGWSRDTEPEMVIQVRRRIVAVVAVAATVTSIAACGNSSSAKPDAPKPYAGPTVTIEAYSAVPEFDFYKSQMADFTKTTGIKVNLVQLPVAGMDQKIPLQLKAQDTGLDVFFTGSEKITDFVGSGGVEPLDSYISPPKKTPRHSDFQ